jgi:hypothetical protein
MVRSRIPLGTWMVVDCTEWTIVSIHGKQAEAELERDRRNRNDGCSSYNALLAIEPMAHGMGGTRATRQAGNMDG